MGAWNDGEKDWGFLSFEGLFGEQVPGRAEVQGQPHDAKVVLGGRWASLHISWPTVFPHNCDSHL